ncbi:MAG: hypothetical protein IJA66_01235 [Alistipes sp.]|nr:hypothetical protein [Alistipes sp.]
MFVPQIYKNFARRSTAYP